ncbi:MAG: S46 family peptidase [Bacteroidota bacterium]
MRKKILSLLTACLVAFNFAKAADSQPINPNEGMWLPHLVKMMNIDDMKKLGFKLSAEELYSVNKSSIKDAIVQMGGFCTGEIVSPKGLMFTNHHCGYDAIATHSTVENDYLTDGFWAKSFSEEIPTEGLTVKFLVRIEDVTEPIMNAKAGAEEGNEEGAIQKAIGELEAKASEESDDYTVQVKPIYDGNQYLLFVYEIFRDVRLVGAPPSAIGKFGGDTDNWMWPRHTGDFSVFRVYAGKDNKPADYSEENVPYEPKHYLPISIAGVSEGDFAMTLGYPGSTDRYLSSFAIEQAYKRDNPSIVKILGERLRIMHEDMMASDEVRIGMASSYASLSNFHKYSIGQNRGLRSRGLIEERQAFEKDFQQWANADSKRRDLYGGVLGQFQQNYSSNEDVLKLRIYMNMAGFGPGAVAYGIGVWRLKTMMNKNADDPSAYEPIVERTKGGVAEHFGEYFAGTDQKVFAACMRLMYSDLPEKFHPAIFTEKSFTKLKPKGGKDRFDLFAERVFATSILTDEDRMTAFLEAPSLKVINKDIGVAYVESLIEVYRNQLAMGSAMFESVNGESMKVFQAGMHKMMPDKKFYPDANSTMRMSYGKVIPYDPRDGVSYKYQTYSSGVLEKEVPNDEEFHVPGGLHDLFMAKDFGRYADDTGELPLCFLTDNDITGGNSGSPVINGNGELIGIAFDGNWESMTSDLVWDDDVVRTISVDIRYVLWTIEKYARATNLIKELTVRN